MANILVGIVLLVRPDSALLALGTFIAGLHVGSWRICVVGGFIALCIPVVAWANRSAVLILVGGVLLVLITAPSVWLWSHEERPPREAGNSGDKGGFRG